MRTCKKCGVQTEETFCHQCGASVLYQPSPPAACSKHHEELDANGIGKCSVPMWMGGLPAGFCDEPAFGKQEPGQRRYGQHEPAWGGKWFDGYCSGLACYNHGGPKTRVFLDGNQWCAVRPDFVNLQESPAGFGDTPELARQELEAANGKLCREQGGKDSDDR